jgi:hypothetical protein
VSTYTIGEIAERTGFSPSALRYFEPTPIACMLDPTAMPDRLAEWRAILDQARSQSVTDDGVTRIEFGDAVVLAELVELVAVEQRCCSFLSFAVTVDGRGVGLEVRAPDGAAGVVAAVFRRPG